MPVGDYEFKKAVADDDPSRCQGGRGRTGQCHMQVVPGSKYCNSHGGNKQLIANQEANKFEYRAGVFSQRIREAAGAENIKDMRQEAGVLKMIIEERLSSCANSSDLMIQAGPIGDLTVKLEKLIKRITEYDITCGNTMDKQQLIQFAEQFVRIASKYVKNEDDKLAFGEEIAGLLSSPIGLDESKTLQAKPIDFLPDEEEEETIE